MGVRNNRKMNDNLRNIQMKKFRDHLHKAQQYLKGAIDAEVIRFNREIEDVQREIERIAGQIHILFQGGQKQRNEIKRLTKIDTDRNSLERLVDANKKLISILQKMKDD